MEITATEVAKLRKATGAGMMDCKKALQDSNGNFDDAIKIIREKGKLIANKRADKDANEGAVIAKVSADSKKGAIILLCSETDFVAKNTDFVGLAEKIATVASENQPADINALKEISLGKLNVSESISDLVAIIAEKIDVTYYASLKGEYIISYIHPGNRLACIVAFNKTTDLQAAKDVAMQVAAMNPVAVDQSKVSQDIIDKELEIGRQQAINEGKPENMIDKIAQGKLTKFFKDSTLLEQSFIKDSKITVRQYLQAIDKELTVTSFIRYSIGD